MWLLYDSLVCLIRYDLGISSITQRTNVTCFNCSSTSSCGSKCSYSFTQNTFKTQVGASSKPIGPIGPKFFPCQFQEAPHLVSSCCQGCIPLATLVALVNWPREGTQHNSGMALETSAYHCGCLLNAMSNFYSCKPFITSFASFNVSILFSNLRCSTTAYTVEGRLGSMKTSGKISKSSLSSIGCIS